MINKNEYIFQLAKELLDDIELSKLNSEQLLLKVSRLARINDDTEIYDWIKCELRGYYADEKSMRFMSMVQRWTNFEKKQGYWFPLATIEANITASEMELSRLTVPNVAFSPASSNPGEFVTGFAGSNIKALTEVQTTILSRIGSVRTDLTKFKSIHSNVLAKMHEYISNVYHTLAFSGYSESIFENYKRAIDSKLMENIPDVLDKMDSVYSRLVEDDPESISHALTSLRRIIKASADKLYPPTDQEIEVDGQIVKLDNEKYLNRMNLYIMSKTESDSRRQRLKQNLRNLNEKVSAGVHSDVTKDEARALLLNTYLIIGEILNL